jgi:hypothetical protein
MFLDFQLPLWPDSASTNATQIDAIYIFLTVVSVIMTILIFVAVFAVCDQVPAEIRA